MVLIFLAWPYEVMSMLYLGLMFDSYRAWKSPALLVYRTFVFSVVAAIGSPFSLVYLIYLVTRATDSSIVPPPKIKPGA